MIQVRTTFTARAAEVETYFSFIEGFIANSSDENLNKILKSNLILMLYNLVESSVTNAIEEIHNSIHTSRISFDLLNVELKKLLIRHLKSNVDPHKFVISINDIAVDIVKKSFRRQKISNGNIDNKTIAKLGREYGFSCDTDYSKTKAGNRLEDIRGKRNDLAHGTFSFTEVGKDYSPQDLEKMKDETINYLSEIISNIDNYLNTQAYKQPATAVVTT